MIATNTYKQFTGTVATSFGYGTITTRPTNTSVNFIIKALEIALPTDFADAVDDKIAANMIDSVTDGSQKAITSNAVFDIINAYLIIFLV